jgi:hypothetical protein
VSPAALARPSNGPPSPVPIALGPREADRRRPCIRARDAINGRRGPAVFTPVLLSELVVQTVIRIIEQDVRVDGAGGNMPACRAWSPRNQAPPGPFTERT